MIFLVKNMAQNMIHKIRLYLFNKLNKLTFKVNPDKGRKPEAFDDIGGKPELSDGVYYYKDENGNKVEPFSDTQLMLLGYLFEKHSNDKWL